jgi:hypothetical protein
MRLSYAIFHIAALTICANQAGAAVITTQAAFQSALNPGFFSQPFTSLSSVANPSNYSGGTGPFLYTLSTATQGLEVFTISGNKYLTTDTGADGFSGPITITFSGTNVNAVGADFFLTDIRGAVQNVSFSDFSLSFSDGTVLALSGKTNTSFTGYISPVPIKSLTFTPGATHRFASIDNLIAGHANVVTPEPSSAALFGCGAAMIGLRLVRRRFSRR